MSRDVFQLKQKHDPKKELYRLLYSYIFCLNMYFGALRDACQRAKSSSNFNPDPASIEVIERFIATGKKLQHILQQLQEKEYQR